MAPVTHDELNLLSRKILADPQIIGSPSFMNEPESSTPDPAPPAAPPAVAQQKFSPKLFLLIGGLAILVVGLLFMVLSSSEKELVGHIKAVDKIMKKNMDDPEKGVDKLIKYFEKHGPDAAKTFVELGIELSQIEGDGDREDRIEKIRDLMKTPMKNIEGTIEKFGEKVQEDEDALERMEDYGQRWEDLSEAFDQLNNVIN